MVIPAVIGVSEWLVIIVVVFVIFFGAKRLPDLARGLGRSVREFKRGLRNDGEGRDEKHDANGRRSP